MKRVIIAIIILHPIIVYSTVAALVISSENAELTALTEEVALYSKNGDSENASAAAARLYEKWYDFERKMSVFVRDDKLNTLSASVAKIPAYITDANDELNAELESIRRQLNLIYRSELPFWYNIL